MAAYTNPHTNWRPTPSQIRHQDPHAYLGDGDDEAVLDPAILDADNMQSPQRLHCRKDSFANSNGVLSPADSLGWEHQYRGPATHEPAAPLCHPDVSDDANSGSVQHSQPRAHQPIYSHAPQHAAWGFQQRPNNVPPGTFAAPPPGLDTPQCPDGRIIVQSQFIRPHGEPVYVPAPQVQTPMLPHSHQDWMGMAQHEMECRSMPKRMRPSSPPTAMVDYARRDGIRKKNGRIEIPEERNIHTIDDLIDRTTDDDLLKELKQQKRLLRNREAALASRQRKKKHTEDLEVKEKGFSQQVAILEKDLHDMSIEFGRCEEERQILVHRYQEAQRHVELLQDDAKDKDRQHNEEASNLRRRINILTEQLDAGPAPAMSANPSSTGFTDFNAEMEALNMGVHDWDNFVYVSDLQDPSPDDLLFDSPKMEMSPTLEKRPSALTNNNSDQSRKTIDIATEQPVTSGLLFMLLLCGAFVASKHAGSQQQALPRMPPDVLAAAPAVLDDLLAEGSGTSNTRPHATYHEPRPSQHATHRTSSRLEQMHNRLTSPTKQQEIDQAFSMTAAQYATINSMDYQTYDGEHNNIAPRRNLAETFANMQHSSQQHSKAEVYTRSLLWDQIPSDVVRQFKDMVRDHNEIEARQRANNDDMFAYKVEA